MKKIPLSVLELAVVAEGGDAGTAIAGTVATAQHAESLGYNRIWMAEHHNMEHIASAATAVLIGHVAGKTKTIRAGSGGIMLPITARWLWPSNLEPWKQSTQEELTWVWAGLPGLIS